MRKGLLPATLVMTALSASLFLGACQKQRPSIPVLSETPNPAQVDSPNLRRQEISNQPHKIRLEKSGDRWAWNMSEIAPLEGAERNVTVEGTRIIYCEEAVVDGKNLMAMFTEVNSRSDSSQNAAASVIKTKSLYVFDAVNRRYEEVQTVDGGRFAGSRTVLRDDPWFTEMSVGSRNTGEAHFDDGSITKWESVVTDQGETTTPAGRYDTFHVKTIATYKDLERITEGEFCPAIGQYVKYSDTQNSSIGKIVYNYELASTNVKPE